MAKVLVIGGGGFVGTPLCEKLHQKGHQVTSLDTFWFGNHHSLNIQTLEWDITKCLEGKLPFELDDYETVIFLASISNDPSAELSHDFTRLVNEHATKKMIDLIARSQVKRLIYASSSSIYGVKEEDKVTEDLVAHPLTLYSQLKYEIEEYLTQYKKSLDYVIVRPATVFGPSKRLRLDVVINILSAHAYFNRKIKIFGGEQYRPNIYIDDMVDFYITLTQYQEDLAGEVYNFGGPNYQVKELANFVAHQCPFDIQQEVIPSNDDRSYRVCSDKAFKKFGIDSLTPIQDGISELMKYFEYLKEENIDWQAIEHSNVSHLKNLLQSR